MNLSNNLDDRVIRSFLIDRIASANKSIGTVIIEELDLCLGEARIDLAIVNGKTIGIEIKSDHDTLVRLPKQIEVYSKVFDRVEIVSGSKLLNPILSSVPDWWGVATVTISNQGTLRYQRLRHCRKNSHKDPYSNAQLLWKSEMLDLLKKKSLDGKFKNKSKDILWNALVDFFPKTEVFNYVNVCLKSRREWRFVHQLESNGD